MRKYLICYWTERNDVATDLEDIVEADNIMEALENFAVSKVFKRVSSISEIPNESFIPEFNKEQL